MADTQKAARDLSAPLFHVVCPAHGELEIFDSLAVAQKSAAEHIKSKHSDTAGNISKTVDLQIHLIAHVTTADLEQIAAAQEAPPAPAAAGGPGIAATTAAH